MYTYLAILLSITLLLSIYWSIEGIITQRKTRKDVRLIREYLDKTAKKTSSDLTVDAEQLAKEVTHYREHARAKGVYY